MKKKRGEEKKKKEKRKKKKKKRRKEAKKGMETMILYGFLYTSMECYDFVWISMDF